LNCWDSLLLSARRTIKLSNSGSHRGQGHAVVNVERNKKIIEYNCRFREVRMVCCIWVLTPPSIVQFPSKCSKNSFNIQYIYMCVRARQKDLLDGFVEDDWFRCGRRIERVFLLKMPLSKLDLASTEQRHNKLLKLWLNPASS